MGKLWELAKDVWLHDPATCPDCHKNMRYCTC
jgi:hypothetical protein